MGEDLIRRTSDGPVTVLALSDPASRNSLSEAMLVALRQMLTAIDTDPAVRCVVLTAEGPVFSSGHHLAEMQAHRNDPDGGKTYVADLMAQCAGLMTSITALRVPVIAAVEGLATAAGCQLVASCDLVVAGSKARFCTPGVGLGLFCATPAVAVSRAIGSKRAMEMLLTAEVIDAATAERFGLVNRVVAHGEALSLATKMAKEISARSGQAIGFGKRAFYDQINRPLHEAYDAASQVMVANFLVEDADEGIRAFLEKRQPSWN